MASDRSRKEIPSPAPSSFPGERLGLPRTGTRSVARLGRRVVALVIDWQLASLLANVVTGSWDAGLNAKPEHQLLVYGVWVALMVIEVPLLGGTIGHRICSLVVTPLRGGWPGIWRPVVRALLLALLVPALVWDSDARGFHDKVAGTVLVRS